MFTMWQFWASLVGMILVWSFIKRLTARVLKRDTVLRKVAKGLWSWHNKLLHAALVAQYAADVNDMVDKNKIPALVEDSAKRAIVFGYVPILDTPIHDVEKISNRREASIR